MNPDTTRRRLLSHRGLALVLLLATFAPSHTLRAQSEDPGETTGRRAGLVVIMNVNNEIRSITDEELRRLFLGKSRRLSNGARAALASYGPEASFFNQRLLGLSDAEVAEAWSRLRFSGRTPPPRTFDNPAEVVRYIAATPHSLGYIPDNVRRDGVRVITNLPR